MAAYEVQRIREINISEKKSPTSKDMGLFLWPKKFKQISGIAKRPGLVGFLNKLVNS